MMQVISLAAGDKLVRQLRSHDSATILPGGDLRLSQESDPSHGVTVIFETDTPFGVGHEVTWCTGPECQAMVALVQLHLR